MKMRLMLAVFGALALAVGVAAATGAGNADNAKKCQKGGWQHLYRSDGTAFKNQGDCVSYAAQGGALVTPFMTLTNVDCTGCWHVVGVGAGLEPSSPVEFYGNPGNFDFGGDSTMGDGTWIGSMSFDCGVFPTITSIYAVGTTAGGQEITSNSVGTPCPG
jgi:hypothetical protein